MKKKIAAIMLAVFMCFSVLTGCAKSNIAKTDSTFVTVEKGHYYSIVYDKDTKVMYTMSNVKGIFTMLVDEDGDPKLWESETELADD